jgi:hypothetical protein
MKRPLTYTLLTFVLGSCIRTTETNEGLYSLYRQRIEDSNYVLYEFWYLSDFATSSDYGGLTILDSSKTFTRSKIDQLPSSYFQTKPTIRDLKMLDIDFEQNPTSEKDTLLTPIGHYHKKFNDVDFEITKYNQTYGSATMNTGLMRYEFDSLKETKDSVTFYNVTKIFGGTLFPSTTSFLKGNIKVIDSTDSKIQYIQIKKAIIERGAIYKPTSPLILVPNQPIIGIATYEFYPRNILKSTLLTDFGIWKRVK